MIIIRVDSLNLKNNKPSIESLEQELFVKLNAPLITLSNIHNILWKIYTLAHIQQNIRF
jgi:hypothetical protein